MNYIICTMRNNTPLSFYHTDDRLIAAIFDISGCTLKVWRKFAYAKRKFLSIQSRYKGDDVLAIVQVEDGQRIMEGKPIYWGHAKK